MEHLLLDAFILYCIGLFLVPNLRAGGRLRRILDVIYGPLARFGLWHRWSMYAPEVPVDTSIALAGVVLDDGSFEVVRLPGFDDETGFGKARGLRFVAFQYALCSELTDYLKPALCDDALRRWQAQSSPEIGERRPVAVEVRVYRYSSPEPGQRAEDPTPEVRTVWTHPVKAPP